MKLKIKDFLLELLGDFAAYWFPYLVIGFYLMYKGSCFTIEQRDLLFGVISFFALWSFWNGKDKDYQIKELENKQIGFLKEVEILRSQKWIPVVDKEQDE